MDEQTPKAEIVRLYNEQQELLDFYRAENKRQKEQNDALRAENAKLRAALEQVRQEVEDWNGDVRKIIGRIPATGIDLDAVNDALATDATHEQVIGGRE